MKAVKVTMLGAAAAGAVLTAAPPASASHACGDDDFNDQEICFWRNINFKILGGMRAFTGNDTTYANDYYTGTSISLNNTISSFFNNHSSRGYYVFRYVGQEGPFMRIASKDTESDLTNWSWSDGASINDTFSSHIWFSD